MKKTLLQEVKDMNRIAGTQMTVEQEIAFIKNRLQELDFTHQASFDAYRKNHKMRPDTKVKIAGKETTVKDASKEKSLLQKLGAKLFGKKEEPVSMPKLDPKSPINKVMVWDDKRGSHITIGKALENPDKYAHLAADIQSKIDTDPDGSKAQKYIDKKNKEKKDSAVQRKKAAEKEKKYQQWRKDNPELAKKQDDEKEKEYQKIAAAAKERDKKTKTDTPYKSPYDDTEDDSLSTMIKRIKRRERRDNDDSGFGGFGGGSFGGGGASGDW